MKKISTLITGLAIFIGMTATAGAYTITYNHNLDSTNGNDFISPHVTPSIPAPTVLNLVTYNLNTDSPTDTPTILSSNYQLVTGSLSNRYAAPNGQTLADKTRYLSVPLSTDVVPGDRYAILDFANTYDYLGLWWGSVDAYNTLTFINKGTEVISFNGGDLIPPVLANGSQTSPRSNLYVNFYGIEFDSIKLLSTNYAFEADNIAVGNVVPEPGTMALLGFGLLGLAVYGKRRMNKEA